jgi:hypothetical protein
MIYELLNGFFFVFHTAVMLFNCFGWVWKKTRRWNLLTLLLTAFSWFFLGIWFGWGYCLCTDWHWEVREKLGLFDQSVSYVHFLLLKLTGINFNTKLVDTTTLVVLLVSVVISGWLNIRDYRRKRKFQSLPH